MDGAHDSDSPDEQIGPPKKAGKPGSLTPAELHERRENHHATLVCLMDQISSLAGETLLMAQAELGDDLGVKLTRNGLALTTGFASLISAEMDIRDRLDAGK